MDIRESIEKEIIEFLKEKENKTHEQATKECKEYLKDEKICEFFMTVIPKIVENYK